MTSDAGSVAPTDPSREPSEQPKLGTQEHRRRFLVALYSTRRSIPPHREQALFSRYKMSDRFNLPPQTPPLYSQNEQSAVEQWRLQVDERIERRIATYQTHIPSELPATKQLQSHLSEPAPCSVHTALGVRELLDMILDFAGPEVQVRALWVSLSWRASAFDVIKNSTNRAASAFKTAGTPVEYDDWRSHPLPNVPNFCTFREAQLASNMQRVMEHPYWLHSPRKYPHIQTLIARSRGLPDTESQLHPNLSPQNLPQGRLPNTALRSYVEYSAACLDMSHLRINPYLDTLFSEEHRITHRMGRWEISLRAMATLHTILLDDTAPQRLLIKAIGSMQVTDPPCQCLGLYYPGRASRSSRARFYTLLRRLRRDDGIRVIDLLNALQFTAPTVLSDWITDAERLRNVVKDSHWIDDIWTFPGFPTVRIHLDNRLMADELSNQLDNRSAKKNILGCLGDRFREAYILAEPSRSIREGEWVPEELFEPMESETGRSPINWTGT